jgi:hypothetical protein
MFRVFQSLKISAPKWCIIPYIGTVSILQGKKVSFIKKFVLWTRKITKALLEFLENTTCIQ